MKKTVLSMITVLLLCVSLVLTGCQSKAEEQKEKATALLTVLYTVPNAASDAFDAGVTDEERLEWGGRLDHPLAERMQEMMAGEVGDYVAEDYINPIWNNSPLCYAPIAKEAGYTHKPSNITLKEGSSEGLYEYTIDLEMTDRDGNKSTQLAEGRIQFNEENLVNYFTVDKTTYTFHNGQMELVP